MHLRLLIVLIIFFIPPGVSGMIMPKEPRMSVRFLYDNLRQQQITKDYTGRRSYNLSYHLPVKKIFRADIYTMIAPDTSEKSRGVDIRQHFYGLFMGASYSYVKLFRYSVSLAPGVWQKVTESKVLGDKTSQTLYSPVTMLRLGLDYAPIEMVETSMTLSLFYRIPRKQWDWSYGFGVNVNI